MTEFVSHYPKLCDRCNRTIATIASHMPEFEDTDDREAPLMMAADNLLLCGGGTCRHGWSVGDQAWVDGEIVTLVDWTPYGGIFDAETEDGEILYREPEDLEQIPETLDVRETVSLQRASIDTRSDHV